MNEVLELLKGPYDSFNVLGGALMGVVAVMQYWMARRHVLGTLMHQAGDDEEKRQKALATWGRMVPPLVVAGILLVVAGFFFVSITLRDLFGG